MTKTKKAYQAPNLRAASFSPSILMAGSFVEGGKPGETGGADANRKHPVSSDNWNNDGNYWK